MTQFKQWDGIRPLTENIYVSGMPEAEYHSGPELSKSGLDKFARSPAHYKAATATKPTEAMRIGSAFHAALLTPSVFASEYRLHPEITDRRVKAYKDACEGVDKDRVLVGEEAAQIAEMVEAARSVPSLVRALGRPDARPEVSGFATCPRTGLRLRHRFDLLLPDGDVAIDVKTTIDARPESFMRSVAQYKYHWQAWLYAYQYKLITGRPLKSFVFFAIEKEAPYASSMFVLDEQALSVAESSVLKHLDAFAECVRTDTWPAYSTKAQTLSLPAWALKDE